MNRTDLNSGGLRIEVEDVFIHDDFNSPVMLANDVALLQLVSPAAGVPTIDLATNDQYEDDETPLVITGWGTTTNKGKRIWPLNLQEAVVPVIDDSTGKSLYHRSFDADTMVCAGDAVHDTCQGDSGGPLFAVVDEDSWVQVGITSWGRKCAGEFPGVYTEVNNPGILDWIAETQAPNPD